MPLFATSTALVHHQEMRFGMRIRLLAALLGALLWTSSPARAGIIDDVRVQVGNNNYSAAESELRDYKTKHGVSPEYLEALSWVARGAAQLKQWDQATTYARETRTLSEQLLTKQKLDSESHLPTAVGAAYEVLAQSMAAKGQTAQAEALLRGAIGRYGNTSIRARLQKNLNVLTMVGRPAPPLQEADYLGSKPRALASLRGSPVLLFFWAHWCVDCKGEAPIIARLKDEFASSGLVVIGPTQLYGYAAGGNDATPAQERAYIESVRQHYYAMLSDMPVPVSKQNFNAYGASTTPTLVILDRAGNVATYHPGAMMYEDLKAALGKAVAR